MPHWWRLAGLRAEGSAEGFAPQIACWPAPVWGAMPCQPRRLIRLDRMLAQNPPDFLPPTLPFAAPAPTCPRAEIPPEWDPDGAGHEHGISGNITIPKSYNELATLMSVTGVRQRVLTLARMMGAEEAPALMSATAARPTHAGSVSAPFFRPAPTFCSGSACTGAKLTLVSACEAPGPAPAACWPLPSVLALTRALVVLPCALQARTPSATGSPAACLHLPSACALTRICPRPHWPCRRGRHPSPVLPWHPPRVWLLGPRRDAHLLFPGGRLDRCGPLC